jgi:murein L,D-transpeptidase YcbB/YkuD
VTGPKDKAGKKRKPSGDLLTREKLLFNMEQWRWMPEDLGQVYVWVNIPEFMVRVVNTREIYSARIVVGRPSTPTPVFSDRMQHLIFHPFWNVPDSIKNNELLPSLAAGDYRVLSKQGLRVSFRGRDIEPGAVDWGQVDMRKYHVYQPPGAGNALGLVKFLFPNKHDVYLHDTPSKRLFHSQARAFSHGCVRVQNPLKLAEVLLAEDQGWTAERVARTVEQGTRDNRVDLHSKVPVHLTYFTVLVDDDGRVRSFSDIYDHEHRVAYALAGKSHLIRREPDPPIAQAPPPQRSARASGKVKEWEGSHRTSSSSNGGDTDWMRRVFRD